MERGSVTTILLLGFPGLQNVRILVFLAIMIIYFTTICGNLLVITLVVYIKNLHCPMYFFLTQLTISDLMISSDIVPNMLPMILHNGSFISISQCMTQLYFFGSSEASECLLLTAKSYDRYLTICHPLHYGSIMSSILCLKLIIISWILSFSVALVITGNVSKLQFCQSEVIDHFFCDLEPVMKISCSNILKAKLLSTILSFPIITCPFLIVVISYVYIVRTILRIQSINYRKKAFSTCGSHLTVVSVFYGTLVTIYLIP
ncbi:olfactory receptor 11L1-like [Phyllobates terribilis]|uniref:olfactory receptor 11L1-like n=1 Tax=Phyllobates terribilis TaxID=111132 RepID=UPI003CCAA1A0